MRFTTVPLLKIFLKSAAAVALCLWLGGCILSADLLFTQDQAHKLVEPGMLEHQVWDEENRKWRDAENTPLKAVKTDAGLSLGGQDASEQTRVLFFPLENNYFIVAAQRLNEKPVQWLYGLVERQGDWVVAYASTCQSDPDPVLESFDMTLKPWECTAKTETGLKAYFRQLISQKPKPYARFKRLDK